jgi:polyphenol oxidase
MDAPEVLRAELLTQHGFRHGFATRAGGSSSGPFASLNLGGGVGDALGAVAENVLRFARAIPFSLGDLYTVSQVHGPAVRVVTDGEAPADVRRERADALVARGTGLAIGVRVADCGSLLLADRRTGAVAAVHAGWRGAVAGVVTEAIRAMEGAHGSKVEDLLVAIGPHIRREHFEVGPEVARELAAAAPGAKVLHGHGERPHADLTAVLRYQLRTAGVAERNIEDLGGCTYADPVRFYSHRRDRGVTGRHLAVIVGR